MTQVSSHQAKQRYGLRRVRLSEWARQEGIARITAYRMLQRGILPVPSERSPTGRWYVLLPDTRSGRTAFYARAAPGPDQATAINDQIVTLTEWAASQRQPAFIVVREIADPFVDPMPKLARLLADPQISDIVIESPAVVGEFKYRLLVAALAPQGRVLVVARKKKQGREAHRNDARAAIASLCRLLYGPEKGANAARRVLESGGEASTADDSPAR